MPRTNRRPAPPRPQTQRCRFADPRLGGRCRSIATVDGFCHRHALELEDEIAHRSPLEAIAQAVSGTMASWFGANRRHQAELEQVIQAGVGMAADSIRARVAAAGAARQVPGAAGAPPRQPPPRGRVPPEAIAARKANIAARGILGFEPDEPLTQDMIKAKRRELARVYHTDNAAGAKDPTREAMMRKINAAADLLMAAAPAR